MDIVIVYLTLSYVVALVVLGRLKIIRLAPWWRLSTSLWVVLITVMLGHVAGHPRGRSGHGS